MFPFFLRFGHSTTFFTRFATFSRRFAVCHRNGVNRGSRARYVRFPDVSPVSLRFGCPATVSPRFGRPDNVFPRFLLVLAVWPPFSHVLADSTVTLGRFSTFRPSGHRFPTFLPCFSRSAALFPRSDRVTVLALCRPISTVTHVFGFFGTLPRVSALGQTITQSFFDFNVVCPDFTHEENIHTCLSNS